MSKKQEFNDTLLSPKYRCCCGCMHVKTATKLCCIILMISFFLDIRKYFDGKENDDWEAIKIIFGFVTAVAPWIGIDKKKSTYFFPSFLGYAIRVVSASITIVSLMFYDYFPTNMADRIRKIYNDLNSSEFDRLNKIFPFAPFCFFVAFLFILLEIRIFFVFYKCYQYVAITSTQGENKQALVKVKKRRNVNLLMSKDVKEPSIKVPSTTRNRISEYVAAILLPFFKLYKKLAPSEYREHPKIKMAADKIAEKALLKSNLKIQEESIPELESETTDALLPSKTMECNSEIHLKNDKMQSEKANFVVKSKTTKIVKKVIKQPLLPKKQLSKSRKNFSSSEQNSFKSMKSISRQSHEEKLFNSTTLKIKNLSLQETKPSKTTTSEPEQHLKITTTETPEHSLLQEKPSLFSTMLKPPSEQNSFITSLSPKLPYPEKNNSKPKKLVSIEIQTNETSFDPRMHKSSYRWQQHNIDSSNDNFAHIQYCDDNNPQFSFTSHQNSSRVTSSGFSSVSDGYLDCSPSKSLSPNVNEFERIITFLFKDDETCAIEIYENGRKEKLKNIFENEWTPLYFSMAQPTPEIGEKAQIHLHKFREHVLYDIFKIVGKPINEIIQDPEWRFKIVEENGIKCFQIKTQKGPRLYPETSIIAAFLKSMKLQTENYLNFEINEIYLCSNFVFTEAQKRIFKIAASKLDLKILSFCREDSRFPSI